MTRSPATVLAAVLLPPLGVYLHGSGRRDFWISCLLTLVGYVPGVAYALHQVLLSQPGRALA